MLFRLCLKCSLLGHPRPTVTWEKDGELVDEDRTNGHIRTFIDGNDYQLVVEKAGTSDAGKYAVTARNSLGKQTAAVDVVVTGRFFLNPFDFLISKLLFHLQEPIRMSHHIKSKKAIFTTPMAELGDIRIPIPNILQLMGKVQPLNHLNLLQGFHARTKIRTQQMTITPRFATESRNTACEATRSPPLLFKDYLAFKFWKVNMLHDVIESSRSKAIALLCRRRAPTAMRSIRRSRS